ncbi:tail fiber domain-containing protein [Roseimarinus sediminis]|uniref:tail fiber domain-containing protein n=1 Tax=Roseimarinus sediminis TaxID=1610899 RepID=UPI003D19FD81
MDSSGDIRFGTIDPLWNSQFDIYNFGKTLLYDETCFHTYYSTVDLITSQNDDNETSIVPMDPGFCNIGTSDYHLYEVYAYKINGEVYQTSSDRRLKENFREIESALDKIKKLKGQKYDLKLQWKDSVKKDEKKNLLEKDRKDHLGFVAQDVMNIIPEAVYYDERSDKYYLEYDAFIPVIVEAMKEQQATIEDLETRIEKLEGNPKSKSANIGNSTGSNEPDMMNTATLGQNIPNPFSDNTRIDILLPETVKKAGLYVYNMQGAQIKSFEIIERGNTSVTIEGFTLDAGMYLYTLIANGKEVDTKKMILTK